MEVKPITYILRGMWSAIVLLSCSCSSVVECVHFKIKKTPQKVLGFIHAWLFIYKSVSGKSLIRSLEEMHLCLSWESYQKWMPSCVSKSGLISADRVKSNLNYYYSKENAYFKTFKCSLATLRWKSSRLIAYLLSRDFSCWYDWLKFA